jgi:D-proline reductase (dithiol) PrdB
LGDFEEFSLAVRVFLRAYPWRRVDPTPWSPLRSPLAEARVALVTSAALVLPGQAPFDETVRGGDPSYRVLDGDLDVSQLRETHRSDSFDHGSTDCASSRTPVGSARWPRGTSPSWDRSPLRPA